MNAQAINAQSRLQTSIAAVRITVSDGNLHRQNGGVFLRKKQIVSRCRQKQPSTARANAQFSSFSSGGPGGTRTLDTLLKSCTDTTVPQGLTEVKVLLRRRYCSCLLGAAAVICSRQIHGPSPPLIDAS
jgi:hypothetical protein